MPSKKFVLLIDDTIDYCMLFVQALKRKNVPVISFESALRALEFLHDSEELPALVFADYRMPEMLGNEFVRRVRADRRLAGLKVFVSSADERIGKIAAEAGADGALQKPFELDQLYKLIDDFVSDEKDDQETA